MLRKTITTNLKKTRVGRELMIPLRYLYHLYAIPHRRKLLQKRGPQVLQDLTEIFQRNNIQAFATCGMLLGFVRENNFISHDDDMDIGVLPNTKSAVEVLDILLHHESGFRYMFGFKYHDRLTEFKVEYKGIPIDFFFPGRQQG